MTIRFHDKFLCAGEICCIHNPSDHPLKDAPMHWRSDRFMMERICPHGVGHPDPDGMAYARSQGSADSGIHGCCAEGCCVS